MPVSCSCGSESICKSKNLEHQSIESCANKSASTNVDSIQENNLLNLANIKLLSSVISAYIQLRSLQLSAVGTRRIPGVVFPQAGGKSALYRNESRSSARACSDGLQRLLLLSVLEYSVG